MSSADFMPRSALAGAQTRAGTGTGVAALVRDRLGLATVMVRKGGQAELARRIQARFGIELPDGPRRECAGAVAFIGTGPGAWLATAERGGNGFAAELQPLLDGLAAVADQTDGYVAIRLTGPSVRDTLAKLVPIDVHPSAFAVGAAASTVTAHIGVTLWRLPDRSDGAAFEIVLFRSLAHSFWHGLAEAAAEFGFTAQLEEPAA